jgi:PAS domain S-box-containing protein
MQRALRESEERFRAFMDNNPAIAWMKDEQGHYVYISQTHERRFGYLWEDLRGKTDLHLWPPEIAQQFRANDLLVLESGRVLDVVEQTPNPDGTRCYWWVFKFPFQDASGLRYVGGIGIDITERRQTEQALRDREERLHATLNTAADAIITIDQRGIIDGINPAAERMFGYSQAEVLGQNVSILMPSPYRDEHDGYVARYLETREPRIIGIGREAVARRKDGSTFPVDLAVSEIRHLGIFTGVIRDISLRSELQRQVLDIAAQEQRRIGQDLHDGVGQELTGLGMVAEGLAQMLAEAKTATLLANAGLTQLPQLARQVSEGIGRTTAHVRELSHGLVPVDVDSQGLMAALGELAASTDAVHDISCTFEYDRPVQVRDNFTATHLYRIAQEAISNALKHSGAKHVRVVLSEQEGRVVLSVEDDGIGIEGESPAGGGGMGLRIMKYRAALIGATLKFGSARGCGTMVACALRQQPPGPVSGRV